LHTHTQKEVFTQYNSPPSCAGIFCILQNEFPVPEDEVFEDMDVKSEKGCPDT